MNFIDYIEKPAEIIYQMVQFLENMEIIQTFLENQWGWNMIPAFLIAGLGALIMLIIPFAVTIGIIAIFIWLVRGND